MAPLLVFLWGQDAIDERTTLNHCCGFNEGALLNRSGKTRNCVCLARRLEPLSDCCCLISFSDLFIAIKWHTLNNTLWTRPQFDPLVFSGLLRGVPSWFPHFPPQLYDISSLTEMSITNFGNDLYSFPLFFGHVLDGRDVHFLAICSSWHHHPPCA